MFPFLHSYFRGDIDGRSIILKEETNEIAQYQTIPIGRGNFMDFNRNYIFVNMCCCI